MYQLPKLPDIAIDANKYSRGSLLVLAGSDDFPGAAILCARAAARTGAGYTSIATCGLAADVVRCHLQSIPVIALSENGAYLDNGCFDKLSPLLGHYNAIVCGPGIGLDKATHKFLASLLEVAICPLILDADALNCLDSKKMIKQLAAVSTPVVLTPHEGELARLLVNTSTTTAEELAAATGTVVVAKGPTTDVTNAAESVALSNGTPALAKAGTGDVLAGVIASLCAQGMGAFDAAVAGVYLHAEAGKVAELKYGRRSVMAEDVIKALPAAIQAY